MMIGAWYFFCKYLLYTREVFTQMVTDVVRIVFMNVVYFKIFNNRGFVIGFTAYLIDNIPQLFRVEFILVTF